ncbi:MAG: CobW family GTP-binding protein [Thiomicrorhabdus chilensis]|uniref:CobW family GTP-binding protein n=1 Tax=Thiomicrorhabdus chilensis TaxID=63656 RepID=UPI00299DBDDA|nr:CobW family GTP-binding protein [Thiomicrorhabdus chilensis]MDX1347877.1 CobW family GTP-binding protein [Thiomicrorhabdus chilensis]
MTASALPVHLISGLLGSGKTTTLKHLLQQKPASERWGILINEFGDIDIDAATLKAETEAETQSQDQKASVHILEVSGGCVCCTAQFGLTQALQQLLKSPLDRLWIEPTGLGHPAKIIDTLKHTTLQRPLDLQAITCVITPQQLTKERWLKSSVMRDLVTLADIVLLNKIDLSAAAQQESACTLLNGLYPPKTEVIFTEFGRIKLANLKQPHRPADFVLLHTADIHLSPTSFQTEIHHSILPGIQACQLSKNPESGEMLTLGWIFTADTQFNRVQLKALFEKLDPVLSRAKGLLKTGKEWQLINWSEEGLQFEDIAWRQDSRLELIFKTGLSSLKACPYKNPTTAKDIEIQLLSCIHSSKKRH